MVEKASATARRLEIPQWKSGGSSDGLPSPTSPLDRASPRGWRHRDAVGLGILAALEPEPATGAAAPSAAAPVAIARRPAPARLEVSELGCSGRCATGLCGGGRSRQPQQRSSPASRAAEFLSCCDMCRRPLDGKDVFMYRGERAFCSVECRYHAIVSDEFQEEKARKRRAAAAAAAAPRAAAPEMAGSPCSGSGQILFTTGIVAA